MGIKGPNFSQDMSHKLEVIIGQFQLYSASQADKIRERINKNQQTANRSTHGNQGATTLKEERTSPEVTPEDIKANIKEKEIELKQKISALFKQNSKMKGSRYSFGQSWRIKKVTKEVIATAKKPEKVTKEVIATAKKPEHDLTRIMENLRKKINALEELKDAKETDPLGQQSKKDLAYSIRMAKPTSRGPS